MTLRSALLLAALLAPAEARPGGGDHRRHRTNVEVPAPASRVFVRGPAAAVLVYVLKPEALLGWSHGLRDADRAMLPPQVRVSPIFPSWRRTTRPNLAALDAAAPDVIVDYGSVRASYVAQAEAVQAASGIPTVLLDGSPTTIPATLRTLGAALGVADRAELAAHAEAILAAVDATLARVPQDMRPRVYLARGSDGLQSGGPGSINAEIIARAGAVNVVDTGEGRNLVDVTPGEVAAWALTSS